VNNLDNNVMTQTLIIQHVKHRSEFPAACEECKLLYCEKSVKSEKNRKHCFHNEIHTNPTYMSLCINTSPRSEDAQILCHTIDEGFSKGHSHVLNS